jgi:hypothetical protein
MEPKEASDTLTTQIWGQHRLMTSLLPPQGRQGEVPKGSEQRRHN